MNWTKPITALALAIALPAFAQNAPEVRDALKPVKLMTVTHDDAEATRHFFGQVVARQTVDLAFQVGGQIVEFPIIEGAWVAKGALIARLDTELYELALDQAKVQKDQADRDVARLSQLTGTTVSQVSLDDAITAQQLAELAVSNAEYNLKHATLVAPFDALVAARDVANFTTVSAGTQVARLHDMSEVRIEIDVPEVLFQRAGKDPNVKLSATFPSSDTAYDLEIREFNAEASTVGQTFRLTFGMPHPPGVQILPGSSVTVSATMMGNGGPIIVPASALRSEADGSVSVLLFEPGQDDLGTLRMTPVKVTPNVNGAFIVTAGLDDGDEIVATGVARLEDGQSARRFTGFPN